MKTYSAADWRAAEASWAGYSEEWAPYRMLARSRGFIYAPDGTEWDSWEDAMPSQRAMLIRAIRETPALLRRTIGESRSWGEVIRRLVQGRDDMRELNAIQREDEAWDRRDDVTAREATKALGDIVERIAASKGVTLR